MAEVAEMVAELVAVNVAMSVAVADSATAEVLSSYLFLVPFVYVFTSPYFMCDLKCWFSIFFLWIRILCIHWFSMEACAIVRIRVGGLVGCLDVWWSALINP